MSERDNELWGMLWRYGLVCLIVVIASAAAMQIFRDNLILSIGSVTAIWLFPMWLASRAHSQASE